MASSSFLTRLLLLITLGAWVPLNLKAAELETLEYPGEELRDGILRMAKAYEAAVAANPESLDGHVGIADTHTMYWCFGFAPRDEVLAKMQTSADKAIKSDGNDAGARRSFGLVKLSQWDWDGAEKELARAVELGPQQAAARHWYALYLAAMGRHAEASEHSKQAVAIDPSPGMQVGRASILYFARDWDQLVQRMRGTIEEDANFAPAYDWLGMAYVQQERFEESIATYEKAVELSGGLAEILAGLGHAYGLAGKEAQARVVLEKLHRLNERWYVPPVQIAYVHVGLGEHDEAIRMLQRAVDEHSWELVFLREEPWFDPLRDDPRFQAIEAKLSFPQ